MDDCASEHVGNEEIGMQSAAEMELESLRARVRDLEETLMRSRADYDNYRKRMERERTELVEFACASFLEDLIPVVDNFELGMKAAVDGGEGRVVSGFSMILEQLKQLLASRGVENVAAVGAPFDPHGEEAVAFVPSDEIPRDHVIQVVRRGYRIGKKLIRPATVVVSSGSGGGRQGGEESVEVEQ
jgi:molecular chaperone GrpE